MKLKIQNTTQIKGTVGAPPSKSYSHRAIILASLSNGTSILKNPLISEDTLASINICRCFGAEIDLSDNQLIIKGNGGKLKLTNDNNNNNDNANYNSLNKNNEINNYSDDIDVIDLKNSGTTLRLMTSLSALSDDKIILTGDESLKTRPMKELLNSLTELGVKIKSLNNNFKAPILVFPGFEGGTCQIDGNVSSQFISSLLIAGALSKYGVEIKIRDTLSSKPYIDMTRDIMSKFNVKTDYTSFRKHDNCDIGGKKCITHIFKVKPQKYISTNYHIEGDYSSASYLLGAVAIGGGEITVKNLFKNSKQGDKLILDILMKMGADITHKTDSIIIKSNGELKGVDVDLHNAPDLLPTVAVLGSLAEGKTTISNVEHGRFKETDRIANCFEELTKLNCDIKEKKDGLEIIGGVESGTVDSHKDHRLAMAFSLIGLKHDIFVNDAEIFNISFPKFIESMTKINIDMNLVN